MSGLIDAEEFIKQFFELETEFRPSQIDAVFDCLYNSKILDVDKKERNMRLIDANALKRYIPTRMDMQDLYLPVHFKTLIDEQPTVDAVPVRHGKWLRTDAFPHRIYCSVCYKTYVPNDRWQIWVDDELPKNYCPNCGAKMDGAEGERR